MRPGDRGKEPSLWSLRARAHPLLQSPTILTADTFVRRVLLKVALVPLAGTHCRHGSTGCQDLRARFGRTGALPPSTSGVFFLAGDATLEPAPAPPMRAAASRAAGDWLTAWLGVVWQRRSSPCAPPQRQPKLIALALSPARLRREGPRRLAGRLLSLLTPWAYDLEP
jgi:hypothetical protein